MPSFTSYLVADGVVGQLYSHQLRQLHQGLLCAQIHAKIELLAHVRWLTAVA